MSYLQCGRTETLTNVILTDVNETETSTNVILRMWTKRKRRQMSYLKCGRNGNVDKSHTYNVDQQKRRQMSYLST